MPKGFRAISELAGCVSCSRSLVPTGLLRKKLHGEVVPRMEAGGVRGAREWKRAAESVRAGRA